MKRLRAPEQRDSRANSPAAGGAPASQATIDPTPVPEGAPAAVTEVPAGAEMSQLAPEASASVAGPQQPNPAPQDAEPTPRCNGEASATLHAATETGSEQC